MAKGWKILKKRVVFRNKWRKVDEYDVRVSNGDVHQFYVNDVPDAIMVFPLTKDGQVVVNYQYNFFKKKRDIELCAGIIEKGMTPLQTVKNELLEETGYKAGKIIKLGTLDVERWNSMKMHCFLALDVEKVSEQKLEGTEDIEVKLMSIEKLKNLSDKNKIQNGPSVLCIYKALDYLKKL